MDYNELVSAIRRYSNTNSDICSYVLGVATSSIHEVVVIAPSWEPDSLPDLGNATLISSSNVLFSSIKVWNVVHEKVEFTYIKTGFGAPLLMDTLLSLGITRCKKIVFIGSVGALDVDMDIGDIVIPQFSICGDGASRYISSSNIEDCWGQKNFPSEKLYKQLLTSVYEICEKTSVKWHIGKTFSSDTIFAQFAHLDKIMEIGCNSIEMETAVAFRCGSLMNIPIVALLIVSDNALTDKSLMMGRTMCSNINYRRHVKKNILPQIIHKCFFDK